MFHLIGQEVAPLLFSIEADVFDCYAASVMVIGKIKWKKIGGKMPLSVGYEGDAKIWKQHEDMKTTRSCESNTKTWNHAKTWNRHEDMKPREDMKPTQRHETTRRHETDTKTWSMPHEDMKRYEDMIKPTRRHENEYCPRSDSIDLADGTLWSSCSRGYKFECSG